MFLILLYIMFLIYIVQIIVRQATNISSNYFYRLRIPWKGGARKVKLDLVLPWIIVPFNLWFCSINLACLLLIHGAIMPFTMYITYRFCLRSVRPQTKFFISWSLSTFFYLFCIYQYQIVGLMSLPKIM